MDKTKRTILDKLPFEITEFDEKVASRVIGPGKKFVRVGPKKYCIQDVYKEYGLDIYNFEARSDDVFLIGFPRSGTTLHCEMIWQIANDLDYEGSKKDIIDYRFPHIDFCLFSDMKNIYNRIAATKDVDDDVKDTAKKLTKLSLKDLAERKGRRFIKSHLPISLMPPHMFEAGAKVIYCARNPKDVMISWYNVFQFFSMKKESIRTLLKAMRNDLVWNCPYFEHIKEGWARRNDDNFLFLFYEDTIRGDVKCRYDEKIKIIDNIDPYILGVETGDISADLSILPCVSVIDMDKRQTMQKIANFLGKKLSNDQLDSLEDYLSLERFKNNKSVNCDHLVKLGVTGGNSGFIGKGKTGGWREHFVGDLEKDANEWMEENLKDTDLKFPEY